MSRLFRLIKNEKGQTLVEFALILPILLLLVMGIIQFGIIFSAQIGITNAAREGARAAAVGHDEDYVKDRVSDTLGSHIGLKNELIETSVTYPDGIGVGKKVNVSVEGPVDIFVPIPDIFVPGNSIDLEAESSMRLEKVP